MIIVEKVIDDFGHRMPVKKDVKYTATYFSAADTALVAIATN